MKICRAIAKLLTVLCVLVAVPCFADVRPVTPADDLLAVLRTAKPGDTFVLADGEYKGGLFLSDKPATKELPITVKAANAGKAVFVGSGTRQDGFSLLRCPNWIVEGLTAKGATRAGFQFGSCANLVVRNCVGKENGVFGILVGNTSFGLIEDSQFFLNWEQHGVYVSGAVEGWVVRKCLLYSNGRGGIQFNNQGSGGIIRGVLVENCSIWGNGVHGAAGINLIGVTQSRFAGNSIHDNLASGIAMSGGCTGNLIADCIITFRAGQGRQCVTSTDSLPVTNTVVNCIVRMGKPATTAVPIEGKGLSVIMQSGNTVLPYAQTVTPSPDPVPDAGITP